MVRTQAEDSRDHARSGIGGWLVLFCFLLVIWEPLALATLAARLLPSMSDLGAPAILILAGRGSATAVGVAAGIGLWNVRAYAVGMAKVATVMSAVSTVVALSTNYLPNSRLPGTTALAIIWTLGYYGAWYAYLKGSRRVRETFR